MKTLLFVLATLTASAGASTLTLDQYINQVKQGNDGYRGSIGGAEGAFERSQEGRMLLAPTVVANFEYADDKRETITPAFQGTRNTSNFYSLGVRQLTTFGLEATLSYQARHYKVYDTLPTFIPLPDYYDTRPVLELKQSLWSNFFGANTRFNQQFLEADALQASYGNSFKAKQVIAQAEGAYWRLALAREAVKVQRESVERAQAMRSYMDRQSNRQLADRSDLLQADAALKVRQLELQGAIDTEQSAAIDFNTIRGVAHGTVNEILPTLAGDTLFAATPPSRVDLRDDVKQARELQRMAIAKAEMGLQKESPTLDVYASLSLNGRDEKLSPSADESFTGKNQWHTFGVRFSAPINFGVLSATRAGYVKEKVAAEQNYEFARFQQEQLWENLLRRLGEAKERLKLSRAIEGAQKGKLEGERQRQHRGRSTTYQVILFEQEFAGAQLNRIRTQAEILDILSQMKTFGG